MPRRAATENVTRLTRTNVLKLALQPGQSERIWWDEELKGFGYRLRPNRGTWVIRPPRLGGKSSLVTIGAANVVDVAEARKAAQKQLAQATLGDHPREARRANSGPTGVTVADAFERYMADAEKRMRPSTYANLQTHLRQHWAGLHAKPLTAVKRADVAAQLRQIAQGPAGKDPRPQAALRARRTLSTVFAWCIGEGLCDINPVTGTNAPAQEIRRERVLTDSELTAVWRACPPVEDFGRIVRLLILTGQRRDEVAGIRWEEIDLDAALWRLPANRTKNKRSHEVPLSPQAAAILVEAPRIAGRPFAFGAGAGPFSGFSKAKGRLDERVAFAEPWRVHDLRRTAATGMARLGASVEAVEKALNHTSGTFRGIVGVYQRHDYAAEKREALNRWAEYVERLSGD
ncbi:Tyrosine recombinase XerC [Methylobacterium mesophilicum]|uniref:tyrosine-type recombinase/integrase n=1 Tax=Methylobacterium mesophilicum TaxID=39956 RepID=UPI002080DC6D|nr:tyrosine-type recombinase/integrase [Methylobacterium mesophilicum]GJE23944.1 Tyrosine recombinase XerC [Methylobacterium mesophilicum]